MYLPTPASNEGDSNLQIVILSFFPLELLIVHPLLSPPPSLLYPSPLSTSSSSQSSNRLSSFSVCALSPALLTALTSSPPGPLPVIRDKPINPSNPPCLSLSRPVTVTCSPASPAVPWVHLSSLVPGARSIRVVCFCCLRPPVGLLPRRFFLFPRYT
ncbi:hypothetical protein ASPZODRAFT_682322 [Penicilliopsis zonata CBS 506.65]|uniref:Uncharacterized protein n=1 Tax=Penicilliopsis zonata CBS 506.65 TaxID=1073090 RepID=A0A1L9SBG2_9EURO|nr:hypothetical protein ASPZODRAFT_682322 [Penicilliopsis zonata CBS 506.65]OJJ44515.1 hypothetical protein ASPZODRAFT_682322 [Penicilliopsis zonata CBS 506.65]